MEYLTGLVHAAADYLMERRILGAFIIMAGFAVLAKITNFVICRIFRYIDKKSAIGIGESLAHTLHRPISIFVLLFGALSITAYLNPSASAGFFLTAIDFQKLNVIKGIL